MHNITDSTVTTPTFSSLCISGVPGKRAAWDGRCVAGRPTAAAPVLLQHRRASLYTPTPSSSVRLPAVELEYLATLSVHLF